MSDLILSYCRCCGVDLSYFPWGEDESSPTYFICDCCGCEAGLDDVTIEGVKFYRKKWLDKGAKWFEEGCRPNDWDFAHQKRNIPVKYR